jgi:hypothetical protein
MRWLLWLGCIVALVALLIQSGCSWFTPENASKAIEVQKCVTQCLKDLERQACPVEKAHN